MACRALEIFLDGRRIRTRSLRWLPIFALTVILASLPSPTLSSEGCEDGTYDENQLTTPNPPSTEVTTSSWIVTASSPNCRNCSERIENCANCTVNNTHGFVCSACNPGYLTPEDNCTTLSPTTVATKIDSTTVIIIAVVVGFVGVLLVAGIIVGIVFGVRKGTFENCCRCSFCRSSSPPPPPMPLPDELGVSFTNKNENEDSGTGQRVDLRYTEEPGPQQNRVESVHYDGYHGPRDDDSVYMNDLKRHIPDAVPEEDEETYANTVEQDEEVYANEITPIQELRQPEVDDRAAKKAPTGSKAPRPRPKPKPNAKPASATKTKAQLDAPQNRESIYPPEDNEDIYANEIEGEDDEEDYVNSDAYQQKR